MDARTGHEREARGDDPVPARSDSLDALSPLQRKTLAVLRKTDEPVEFSPEFVDDLVGSVHDAFQGFHERIALAQPGGEITADTERIFVSKYSVSGVLGCEVQHLHADGFQWSPANAGGQIAHRAIQLMLNWPGEPVPSHLVSEAIARLTDGDNSLADWLAGMSDADVADLRSIAVDKVAKFQECFPPLPASAAPRTETRVSWPTDGPIVLSGKYDLVLGRPNGRESTKVIIDLKTGWSNTKHREDLRFYALVETLRSEVPPRKLASFYLDSGDPVVEDVAEATLRTATRRTLDAIHAEIELRFEGREPQKRAGTSCRWCPLAVDCPDGAAYLLQQQRDRDE
jgi:hypothetical protein